MTTDAAPGDIPKGEQPATNADVHAAVDELAQISRRQFDRVNQRMEGFEQRTGRLEGRLDAMDDRLARVERGQEAILDVVNSIDERLKQWRDVPERIERLEDIVFTPRQ